MQIAQRAAVRGCPDSSLCLPASESKIPGIRKPPEELLCVLSLYSHEEWKLLLRRNEK